MDSQAPSNVNRSHVPSGNHTHDTSRSNSQTRSRSHRTLPAEASQGGQQGTRQGSHQASRAPTLNPIHRSAGSIGEGSLHRGITQLIEQVVAQAVATALQNPGARTVNVVPTNVFKSVSSASTYVCN